MDFAIREWLTVIIVLLIVAVVLDGLRRVRQARRNAIKMSLSMHQGVSKDDLDVYGSELPNGGARISRRDNQKASEVNSSIRKSTEPYKPSRKVRIPEQVTLNLDESVPMLMESVDEERPSRGINGDELEDVLMTGRSTRVEPTFSETSDAIDSADASAAADESSLLATEEPVAEPAPMAVPAQKSAEPKAKYAERSHVKDNNVTKVAKTQPAEPEEVLVINVMAKAGTRFHGNALLDVLLAGGLRFGAMNIFHRHLRQDGSGPVLFSLANIVMPGTFDLQALDDFYTPGVSLFMTLPIEAESIPAFETMVTVAQSLADELGGELKDESRSVMTQQTIAHYRQRVKDFERRRLSLA